MHRVFVQGLCLVLVLVAVAAVVDGAQAANCKLAWKTVHGKRAHVRVCSRPKPPVAPLPPALVGGVEITGLAPARPETLVPGDGVLWVQPHGNGTILELDPTTNKIIGKIGPIGLRVCGIDASIPGSLWVSNCGVQTLTGTSGLFQIDTQTGRVDASIPGPNATPIVVGAGAVWATDYDKNTVWRVDPTSNTVVAEITTGPTPTALTFAYGSVWVTNTGDGTVSRIDPATNSVVATIQVGGSDPNAGSGPNSMIAAANAIWIGNNYDNKLYKIDPATNAATAFDIGAGQRGIWNVISLAYGFDSIFALAESCTIVRVDPGTGAVTNKYTICDPAKVFGTTGLEVAYGSLWFSFPENHTIWRIQP